MPPDGEMPDRMLEELRGLLLKQQELISKIQILGGSNGGRTSKPYRAV